MFLQRSDRWDWRRFGVLLLALLQIGAAGVQSADAVLEAGTSSLPTHVESHESEHCEVQHDHLFCQVVRSLTAVTGGADAPTIVGLQSPTSVRADIADLAVAPTVEPDEISQPRAPPLG